MIQVVVRQHTHGTLAGKWDIYIHDRSEAGDLLVFSNQGYELRQDAERIIERLFACPRTYTAEQLEADPSLTTSGPEPVDLVVRPAFGNGGSHRMVR